MPGGTRIRSGDPRTGWVARGSELGDWRGCGWTVARGSTVPEPRTNAVENEARGSERTEGHRERRHPTQTAGPDTKSPTQRAPGPDTQSAGPFETDRSPTQRLGPTQREPEPAQRAPGPRHRERRGPIQRAPARTQRAAAECRGPTQRAPGPNTENERAPGPDTESVSGSDMSDRAPRPDTDSETMAGPDTESAGARHKREIIVRESFSKQSEGIVRVCEISYSCHVMAIGRRCALHWVVVKLLLLASKNGSACVPLTGCLVVCGWVGPRL